VRGEKRNEEGHGYVVFSTNLHSVGERTHVISAFGNMGEWFASNLGERRVSSLGDVGGDLGVCV